MSSDSIQLILLVILLSLSAFFSASETALMALSKIRVRNMVEDEVKGAKIVDRLVSNPSKLLSAILVGNNLVNIGASALATSLAIKNFGAGGVGIATAIMTVLVLIFGEVTPKSIAANNPEGISLFVAKPLNLITQVFRPLTTILMFITNSIVRLFGIDPNETKPFITQEELKTMVQVSHEEGVLESEERSIIDNVLEFKSNQVHDVMTNRTEVTAVDVDSSFEELIEVFAKDQFSRLPVYEESIDNIIGIINVKDLLMVQEDRQNFSIRKYMRDPFFTYDFQKTAVLFEQLRREKIGLAIVLDEYGGTAGVITLEDLVEEIVGDIEDEYDETEKEIERLLPGVYRVSGLTRIEEVNEHLGLEIETENFDTIGGFMFGEFGTVPEVGDEFEFNGYLLKVERLDKNRIDKIIIKSLENNG